MARALEAGYRITVTPAAKRFVAEAGYDPAYGARPLRRAITKFIEDPVSEAIIADRIQVSRKKGLEEVRELKVGLAADKESIAVSLKAQ